MRWCVALGIVLAALVALTVKVSARRPRAVMALADEAEPDQPDAPRELTPPSAQPPAAEMRRTPWRGLVHTAAAHIFGRVLASVDEEASFEDLTVTADDGARSLEARVLPDGRFSLHLSPGQYVVTASLGDLVGIAPSVAARPGAERELTIQLRSAAAIRGHIRGPDGVEISVRVSLAGRDSWQQTVDTEDGDFALEALVPGRSYDLSFAGKNLRTTTLRSVTAPAKGVAAVIEALPILYGAVGFPFGECCPIDRVALRPLGAPAPDDDDDDDSDDGNVDSACQFQLPVPDGASQVLLVATGSGWNLEEPVSIPPLGDPEPVCLNPPCRANPRGGQANIRISLEGDAVGGATEVEGQIEDEFVVQ
jgi:hypothetical protein